MSITSCPVSAPGLSGSDDVGALAARLDDTQHDLEAGNAALLARNLRLVPLLAEDAVTLTGPAQVPLSRGSAQALPGSWLRLSQGPYRSSRPSSHDVCVITDAQI